VKVLSIATFGSPAIICWLVISAVFKNWREVRTVQAGSKLPVIWHPWFTYLWSI
jgi:hypothetical protein